MRHAGRRRRARTPVRQVLSGGDGVPAVRHRGGVSLSMGRGAARAGLAGPDADRDVLPDSRGGLHLYLAQGDPRVGARAPPHGDRAKKSGINMGLESDLELPVLTTTVEKMVQWARKSAIWPVTFGLA